MRLSIGYIIGSGGICQALTATLKDGQTRTAALLKANKFFEDEEIEVPDPWKQDLSHLPFRRRTQTRTHTHAPVTSMSYHKWRGDQEAYQVMWDASIGINLKQFD